MFRPPFVLAALALGSLSPMLSCATAVDQSNPGDGTTNVAGGGSSAQGGSGVSGSVSTGGKPGSGVGGGSSGSTGIAGSTSTGRGGAAGTGGGSSSAGTGAGGATTSGGTSSAGGTSAGGSSAGGTSAGGSSAGTTGSAGSSPGGASGTVLFSDDFEDNLTDKWITSGGTWALVTDGTKAYAQTATGTGSTVLLSAAGSPAWTDQIVEARVKVTAFGGQSTSYFAAIYARFTGPVANNTYYALLLRSDGKLVIRKGNSSIGNAVSAAIVAGTWYTVRFEVVGSTLKASLNGVLQSTVTDASLTAGGIAVSVENATAEFDDIKVTTP